MSDHTNSLSAFMQQFALPDKIAAAEWIRHVGIDVALRESGLPENTLTDLVKENCESNLEACCSPINLSFGIMVAEETDSVDGDQLASSVSLLDPEQEADLPESFLIDSPRINEEDSQGGIGSCVSWGGKNTSEVTIGAVEGDSNWKANPSSLYIFIKEKGLDPWPQRHGSTLRAQEQALKRYGIAHWDDMPVHRSSPKGNPANLPAPPGIYQKAEKNRVQSTYWITEWNDRTIRAAMCLMSGKFRKNPVRNLAISTAFYVPASLFNSYTARTGIVLMPPSNDPIRGGHAVTFIGWKHIKGRLYFIVKNSWGTDFGDRGYLYFPVEYIKRQFKASFVAHMLVREVQGESVQKVQRMTGVLAPASGLAIAILCLGFAVIAAGWFPAVMDSIANTSRTTTQDSQEIKASSTTQLAGENETKRPSTEETSPEEKGSNNDSNEDLSQQTREHYQRAIEIATEGLRNR